MSYGNMHHVEIFQHKVTDKYKGEFITMMQASHRARGIQGKLNPTGRKQPQVKTQHGDDWKFVMALYINDLVSIQTNHSERQFYRIQKLDSGSNRVVLRKNQASTLQNKEEELYLSISAERFREVDFMRHQINAIGILTDDQTNS